MGSSVRGFDGLEIASFRGHLELTEDCLQAFKRDLKLDPPGLHAGRF